MCCRTIYEFTKSKVPCTAESWSSPLTNETLCSPRELQLLLASRNIVSETSTPTTESHRLAKGTNRRPTPHPKSKLLRGTNCSSRWTRIVCKTQSMYVSPDAKNSLIACSLRFCFRKRSCVRTAQYGSVFAKC